MIIMILIYSDGASRGNPGPASIAYVILSGNEVLCENSEYVGMMTNNQVEYFALISALKSASNITDAEVICHVDSQLVAKQLNGLYRTRNSVLKEMSDEVIDLAKRFSDVTFTYVPREDTRIRAVDRLANQTLDELGF